MPTNEERRKIAAKLRKEKYSTWDDMLCEMAQCVGIRCCNSECHGSDETPECAENLAKTLADLIEPDYQSEESGYFILPKPKEPLFRTLVHFEGFDIERNTIKRTAELVPIQEAVSRWRDSMDGEIKRALFAAFGEQERTCEWVWGEEWIESSPAFPRELQWANWYLNCGCWDGQEREFEDFYDPNENPSNGWEYCPMCGAKVVDE